MNTEFSITGRQIGLLAASLCCFTGLLPGIVAAAPKNSDISLLMAAHPNPVLVGGQLSYSFTVRNEGSGKVKRVKLIHTLPGQNLQFLSMSANCKNKKSKTANVLTCRLGTLSGGASIVQAITVKLTKAGTFPSSAKIISTTKDANKANNAAAITVRAALHINQRPSASDFSLTADPAKNPQVVQNLIGTDPDNDTLTFALLSPASGAGYTSAWIQGGKLYVTLAATASGTIRLQYRTTDGQDFSDPANVVITIAPQSTENGTGLVAVDEERLALTRAVDKNFVLSAAYGATQATVPVSVDLSADFPEPRNQGQRGSCVAWATGYALKSYQERREIGWTLDRNEHLFSPAYLFNQIAQTDGNGEKNGAYIVDALKLMEKQGVSTWASMPYSPNDPYSQPSQAARQEAAYYKAVPGSMDRPTSRNSIKALLSGKPAKPVVVGIVVFDSINNVSGANPVYNTASGAFLGLHAVTIVGYDDTRYGGAYKIINSWGTGFGDHGYFWMPYTFAESTVSFAYNGLSYQSVVMNEYYTVTDGANTNPTNPNPPPSALPNLQVESWDATYTASPGGDVSLKWKVVNTGDADAAPGVDVNFMLSRDQEITSADIYIFYEEIPFAIEKNGGGVYRDDSNPVRFNFPDWVSGEYYAAMWVDDLDEISESNEDDNVAHGENKLIFKASRSQPDLVIDSWSWYPGYYRNYFTFKVANQGNAVAKAGWYVNLVLSPNVYIGDGDEYFLFYQKVTSDLATNSLLIGSGYFSLSYDAWGYFIPYSYPYSDYYLGVWLDDMEAVAESNESNNVSIDTSPVCVGLCSWLGASAGLPPSSNGAVDTETENAAGQAPDAVPVGKKVRPPKGLLLKKVRISEGQDGRKVIEFLDGPEAAVETVPQEPHFGRKTMRSEDTVLHPPLGEVKAMPQEISR